MNTKEFKFQFFSLVIGDILRALDGRSLIGAATLSMLALDYLAYHYYLNVKEKKGGVPENKQASQSSSDFIGLLEDYLPTIRGKDSGPKLAEYIWATRCSLVHVYGISQSAYKNDNLRFSFSHHQYQESHLEITTTLTEDKTYIKYHLPIFISEIIILCDYYFDNLNQENESFKKWSSEFIKIYDLKGQLLLGNHNQFMSIHSLLAPFDVSEKVSPPIMVDILSKMIYARLNP